jgi:carbon monoxide dehydrogenase subunit G
MKLTDQCVLQAAPEAVWRALNDPVVLEACLPGCKSLTMLDDRRFESIVQIRVGPVVATFKSNVELSDLDPPRAYTISGMGNAGAVGFAKVTARVRLEPQTDATVLGYDADVEIGGKLMSVGSRLVQSAATMNLDSFFDALKAHIERNVVAPPDHAQAVERPLVISPGSGSDHTPLTEIGPRPEPPAPGATTLTPSRGAAPRWPLWLVGAGSGVVGLVVGFLVAHAS